MHHQVHGQKLSQMSWGVFSFVCSSELWEEFGSHGDGGPTRVVGDQSKVTNNVNFLEKNSVAFPGNI